MGKNNINIGRRKEEKERRKGFTAGEFIHRVHNL
jgi:hypothetical protein